MSRFKTTLRFDIGDGRFVRLQQSIADCRVFRVQASGHHDLYTDSTQSGVWFNNRRSKLFGNKDKG